MNVSTSNTVNICPMCEHVVSGSAYVEWEIVIHGRNARFRMQVCEVDATLCEVFGTLRAALWAHPATVETLAKLLRDMGAKPIE